MAREIDFLKYKKILSKMAADVLPRVIAESVNVVASFAHAASMKNVRTRFVNRNAYTERSLRFYKAKPRAKINQINAVSGSISDYMDEQDSGGYRYPKSGSKAPIATLAARVSGQSSKVVRKVNRSGQLAQNQFVGTPKGKLDRPHGVYQRTKKNKYLVMIRNISKAKIKIEGKHWHKDAVDSRYRPEVLTAEFVRQAKIEIEKLKS